jgi:hypothetical protein
MLIANTLIYACRVAQVAVGGRIMRLRSLKKLSEPFFEKKPLVPALQQVLKVAQQSSLLRVQIPASVPIGKDSEPSLSRDHLNRKHSDFLFEKEALVPALRRFLALHL